jgi:hypothetical protein
MFNTCCFSASTVVTRTCSNITLCAPYLFCYTLHSPYRTARSRLSQVDVRLEVEHAYIVYINMYYITCHMLGRMLQITNVNSLMYSCHSVNKFLKIAWKFLFRDHRTGSLMISIISSHVCLDCLYVSYLPNVSTDNRNTEVDRVDEQVTRTNYSFSYKFRKPALESPTIWAVHRLAGRTRSHIPYQ